MEGIASPSEHPPHVLPAIRALAFVCPACRGPLRVLADAYSCAACDRVYPVHAGIPDFRLFPDPYLDFDEDRDRTEIVLAALDDLDFRGLLEHYWSFSDVTPPLLRQAFVENAMRAEHRGQRILERVASFEPAGRNGPTRLLEIGCGTGNLLAGAAGAGFDQVVGTDIAMRWLHLSRRRFLDRGLPVPALVCCCAESLPFEDDGFEIAIMASTLEFLKDPGRALEEAARVLSSGGGLHVNTVNRHSLATNPYALVWGVGYLPHALQVKYVRWRRDASFENVKLKSLAELVRLADRAFGEIRVDLADVSDEALASMPTQTRWMVKLYRVLKATPWVRSVLKRVAPEWDVLLRRPRSGGASQVIRGAA